MSSTSSSESATFLRQRVATILEGHSGRLIEDWTAMLRQSLPDDLTWRLSDQELATGIEPLLGAILIHIRSGTAITLPTTTDDTITHARALGLRRRDQGYSLRDVVHENILFQQRLWALLKHTMRRTDAEFLEVIRRINDGIDQVLLEAVNTFHEQDTAELRGRAVTDTLLGVYNRDHFDVRIQEELKRAERFNQPFSLLLIDTDRFKSINDKYGHREGDQVLQCIAASLRESVRDPDIMARYGGDEFAIILPNTGRRGAWTLALRLTQKVEADLSSITDLPSTTISVGIAMYPIDGKTETELIDAADAALYRSKAIGGSAISCFSPRIPA